jgi:hypothetical protein
LPHQFRTRNDLIETQQTRANANNNAATSADVLGGFLQMIRMMVSINTIKHLNRHAEETRGLPTVCALHRVPGTQRRLLSNLCLMDRLKR